MCRAARSLTLFPKDFISLKVSKQTLAYGVLALEPRISSKVFNSAKWPSVQTIQAVGNELRLVNSTGSPIFIPKNEQICQVRATHIVDKNLVMNTSNNKKNVIPPSDLLPPFTKNVIVEPNNKLSIEWKE